MVMMVMVIMVIVGIEMMIIIIVKVIIIMMMVMIAIIKIMIIPDSSVHSRAGNMAFIISSNFAVSLLPCFVFLSVFVPI